MLRLIKLACMGRNRRCGSHITRPRPGLVLLLRHQQSSVRMKQLWVVADSCPTTTHVPVWHCKQPNAASCALCCLCCTIPKTLQRFFWTPVESNKPRVTIVGRADFPREITIRGKWVSNCRHIQLTTRGGAGAPKAWA